MPQASHLPTTMRAVAIHRFGGEDVLQIKTLPVPAVDPGEVVIRVESAGVAEWDPFEREGGFAKLFGVQPTFPYVLGTDGAGHVVAVGEEAKGRFAVGDRAYAAALMNPKGGFYAEYAAVKAEIAARVPDQLTTEQAGVFASDAMTGLAGLDDVLHLKSGESLMIFGAGGGIGHLAVQLARRIGARVFAVASGADGVELARSLRADAVVDGRKDDIVSAARAFAPNGLDAALMTAGGAAADRALTAMRDGSRVAYPNGVEPEPHAPRGVTLQNYDVEVNARAIERLNRLIGTDPFTVHVARTFPMEKVVDAHRYLEEHFIGLIGLRVGP